jgi:aldose 1-epimerase
MQTRKIRILASAAFLAVALGCLGARAAQKAAAAPSVTELKTSIGGRPVVELRQPHTAPATQPQILSVQILPGRGMNIFQIQAYVSGKGVVDLLASPSLDEAQKALSGGADDLGGNRSFTMGGAILLPFANRIRGKLLPGGKYLETNIMGQRIKLLANWKGKNPGAEPHAMHGLILNRAMDKIAPHVTAHVASVNATLAAGNFEGHWLSRADVGVFAQLAPDGFNFAVTVKNVGKKPMPVGIGWHPYFRILSGDRQQARLHVPARERVLVNNYDDVFPTGKLEPVKGTPYDFQAANGAPLGKLFMDDCFVNLDREPGKPVVVRIIDPASHYGLRIKSLSPQVSAFQVYAPPAMQFIVVEPQFNWGDPFSPVWDGHKTGMVILQPGQSVTYRVEVDLFIPPK